MPVYEDLQFKAKNLAVSLTHALVERVSYGGLFCTCFPSITNQQLFNDADLIRQTAECLDFYTGVTCSGKEITPRIRYHVLVGIYLYVWYQYDNLLQSYLNKPLLKLFQQHLGLSSLSQLEPEFYKSCLEELDDFCNWVYEKSNQYQQTHQLFQAFPSNMQGNLHIQKEQVTASLSWDNLFSGLMTKIGIKSLF
ncbi:hypothetical protein [Legionella jamestowniensis]|uniref:Uncharacterized protein n=1 Tax=Legionella jamestowniensis TaxID=455 RepID=A0A0W0UHS8_9GAMM|nr:hypothetical protein [Legionella jamestowniensis]KTD07213.1 hypothetical protein Ljam_1408 [Legionella jamestowniensis]OCH98860.1 hypothetical protein A8135_08840 [Legionella jamestowniensis]SFL72282.1 hypothetical protein SAMN02746073_1640 [Legionella jamestowniensis DSM 19215]